MTSLRRDLISALRRFYKVPGFVFAVVVSIGLGIGANATIFSAVSTFLLRPPPVGDPATLMSLYTTERGNCCGNNLSWPLYQDLRGEARSLSGIAAFYPSMPVSLGGYGEPERVWGSLTSSNFFDVTQVRMVLGRGFTRDEEQLPVAVLSHRLWQRHFDSDPSIVGKSVSVSGHPFTIVGIAAASFHGLDIFTADLWVPLGNQPLLMPKIGDRSRSNTWLEVAGRLAPGITSTQAATELNGIAGRLAESYPATDKDRGFQLEPAGSLPPDEKAGLTGFLVALSVVALLVLCIACANVVNLLLAQAYARQREMAVRLSLGAQQSQLIRQMLVESILLALGGGGFGLVLCLWATSALSAFHLPIPLPIDLTVGIDGKVLFYASVLSIGTGLTIGIIPAWVASRPILTRALKGEESFVGSRRRWSLRNLLVLSQMFLSLVLLCATGLFLRSLQRASHIDIGFRSHGILMMNVDPQLNGYSTLRATQFLEELRRRVRALPGVISVAWVDPVPLSMDGRWDDFHVEDGPKASRPNTVVDLYMVTPDYFQTIGISRLAGRDFAHESADSSRVAVVNETFIKQLFVGRNPIGQRVTGSGATYEIVGVVKDSRSRTLGENTRPILYRSMEQDLGRDPDFRGISLLVRTDGNPALLEGAVRNEIHSLDPTMAIFHAETMEEHLRSALFLPRLAGTLFGIFGFTGLLLAAIGLYGMMSYSVSRRTREIGIRLALGAQVGAVQRLVVRQGMILTSIALALGLPCAFALSKFAASILYGIRPHDAVTFTAVPLFLTTIALLACWIPALRVARVEPQTALRCE
ncbi:ABC transporter permease [Acidobacterium sp. S8]|uniref:ABC transporter permease n=1 Tax=Acidobacterium sp. S8 TaxID=1641854 RepID=UPI00131C2F15|nr:ABC transporter permease [Acidobacterium sp. S8]